MQLPLIGVLLTLCALHLPAHAGQISAINSTARALGMGDAYTALADDSSALFFNPAGLSRVSGLNWKIFSLRVGTSGLDAYKKISDLSGAEGSDMADQIEELYGEHIYTGLGVESAFTAPMFGFAIFDHADALVQVDNPVYPEISTSVINDYGYVAGMGAPIGPFFEFGVAFKYVKRTGARVPFAAGFLADLDTELIMSHLTGWGKGYGADAGFNVVLPAPFFKATFSTVWRNIGQMHFRSDNPDVSIPFEDNDLTLGLALQFDLPLVSIRPAIDFRYLNSADYQLTRKINFGVEVGLPLVDIRAGFREGYYTYGVGMNLGLFQVDAASYGAELGAYPGQIEDRRYVVEFSMELGVGNFSARGADSASGGGAGGKSGKGGSSSRSIWGSGRLKQRR
ncbi:MAG: hypothetical protein KF799_08615 [Bdellovibrionales bacterium]|nr:hypothetical protein [Bdellovibrionales bacterium]